MTQVGPLAGADDFPGRRRSTYLNTASVGLIPSDAVDAQVAWQRQMAETGTIDFDEEAERSIFEPLRKEAATLFGADVDGVAVGSNATELLSSFAWAVSPPAGSNVVGAGVSFPSTMYPWRRIAAATGAELRLVEAGTNDRIDPDALIQRIDASTAVVCVSHVEYRSGQLLDLARLADAAHRHGALLVVDATQSAGMIPIDVVECGVDALVTSGYKWLCGPFGVALLVLNRDLRGRLDPGTIGFRSHVDMWDLDTRRLELPDAARRFECSTMAYGCAISLARSIALLNRVGVDRIFAHDMALTARIVEGLRRRGAEVTWPEDESERTPIVSTRFPDRDSATLARHLNGNRVVVSPRGEFVRFSPHLYNDDGDVERALKLVDAFLNARRS